MGGSSPQCGTIEEGSARSAFSRGYPSKRLLLPVSRSDVAAYNARIHASKVSSRGESCYSKCRDLAFKILGAAFGLWILFQVVVVLDANKHSDVRDGLKQFPKLSQSLLNATLHLKHKPSFENRVQIQRKVQNWPSLRHPRIALVLEHAGASPESLFAVTLAQELQLLDYELEVYTLAEGSLRSSWEQMRVPLILISSMKQAALIDWSRYEGVLAFSYSSRYVISSLLQEPFKSIPLVLSLQDCKPLEQEGDEHRIAKQLIKRAKAVVFPHQLPDGCAPFDTGNFFPVSGSPLEIWEAEKYMLNNDRHVARLNLHVAPHDFVVVVGSTSSSAVWRAHAMAIHAVANMEPLEAGGQIRIFVLNSGNIHHNYDVAVQAMAAQFRLDNSSVKFMEENRINEVLWAADVVVYVALDEERFFPPLLIRAIAFERLVLAPASQVLQQYIADGVNGFIYPREDYNALCSQLDTIRKSRDLTSHISSAAKSAARNLLAREAVAGYAELLEATLEFPSEVSLPKSVLSIQKVTWRWDLVDSPSFRSHDRMLANFSAWDNSSDLHPEGSFDEIREEDIAEEKLLQVLDEINRAEEEEAEERKEQIQSSYEDVTRSVKKAEREKFEFHERDDGELERTGQPLCIYETYYGPGAWPFLHQNNPLYRGLSLSARGRRPRADDVDGTSRLSLLNDTYYRDVLCDFGAFLAIANRIDRVHKNSWIGFQPWSVAGRKAALSQAAETSLVEDLRTGKHGDAVYFWVRADDGASTNDFWSMCDAHNAGSCRRIFLDTFRRMYGVYGVSEPAAVLPFMPAGAWSAMHSWVMPTSSFVEFVLFSRMFLDSLDSHLYADHHGHGECPLASTKLEAQHCYCRILESLVNVWAYHSARRLVQVDPQTGELTEQHDLEKRRGLMRIKWFSLSVLKGMDEDLAQKADEEHPNHRWLWPHTGEVFWQGILERERQERYNMKVEKKRRNKERLARMRSRYKQKSLGGRYVKPAPDLSDAAGTSDEKAAGTSDEK